MSNIDWHFINSLGHFLTKQMQQDFVSVYSVAFKASFNNSIAENNWQLMWFFIFRLSFIIVPYHALNNGFVLIYLIIYQDIYPAPSFPHLCKLLLLPSRM